MTFLRKFLIAAVAGAPYAASAATINDDALSSRENILLVALSIAGIALVAVLIVLMRMRARFRKHITERRDELKRAFADAYVGMKDSATDAKKVRDAERAMDSIIKDLENFM